MASSFNISVGADTSKLERDIQQAAARLRKPIDIKIKDNASGALGNITGKTTKFNDALDAATARVVAFGAAAGAFNLVRKGVEELLRSTIEVESSLARININLNETQDGLKQFSKNIFDIARNTGQTFETAAKAAEELTRQGLTATETTTRLRDALILSRLAAIDSDQAVNSLTASINSFSKEALNSTEILNKLAAVDAKFAVSTADLAAAISRVGSSASDAGVSFDQLLGIVTSVQQTTARGGAVIGNALKTIFTRIERSSTLDDLEALGIGVRDIQGKTLPAIQILTELAKTYDTLSDAQRSAVAEQVGGVFQINILKAALGDLSKEYSVYTRALQTAAQASDEAFRKNEILNQTLTSSFNELRQSFTQLFAEFGRINLNPLLKTISDGLTGMAKFLSGSDIGKDAGKSIGENILQGVGNVLTGPGVIAIAAILQSVMTTLIRKVGAEFGDAVATSMLRSGFLGGTVQAGKIVQAKKMVPRAAGGLLPSVAGEMASINSGIGGATRSARPVVIPNFNFGGGKRGPVVANTDEYMVPNFAGTGGSAIFNKNMVSMYGLPRGAKKLAEGYVPNFAAIYRGVNPKFGDTNAGINSIGIGNKLVAAVGRGNYTDNKEVARLYGSSLVSKNIKDDKLLELASYSDIIRLYDRYLPKSLAGQIKNSSGTEQLRLIQAAGKNLTAALLQKGYSGIKAPFAGGDNAFLASKGMGGNLFIPFADGFIPNFAKISATKISGELEKKRRLSTESGSELEYLFNPKKKAIEIDHIRSQKKGDAFQLFTALTERSRRSGLPIYSGVLSRQYGAFDPKTKKYNEIAFNSEYSNYENLIRAYPQLRYRNQPGLKNFFNMSMVDTNNQDETFYKKFRSLGQAEKFVNNISKWDFARYFRNDQFSISGLKTFAKAGGYVPNFANPLGAAIARERAAGVPSSQIYIDRDRRVINKNNPLGLLIANRNDEPLGGHQGVTRMLKQGRNPFFAGLDEAYDSSHFYNKAKGYVPNFAVSPDRPDRFNRKEFVQRGFFIEQKQLDKLNSLFNTMGKVNGKALESAMGEVLKIEKEVSSVSSPAGGLITGRRLGVQRRRAFSGTTYTGGGEVLSVAEQPSGVRGVANDPLQIRAQQFQANTELRARENAAKKAIKEISYKQTLQRSLATIEGGGYIPQKDIELIRKRAEKRILGSEEFRGITREQLNRPENKAQRRLFNLRLGEQVDTLEDANTQNKARIAEDRLEKRRQKFQSRLLNLSLVSSFAAPAIESAIGGVGGGVAGGALQGVGIGAMFGPKGAIIGGVVGGLVGAFQNLKSETEKLSMGLSDFAASTSQSLQNMEQYVQGTEDLEKAISSGADNLTIGGIQKRVSNISSQISPQILERLAGAKTIGDRKKILEEESIKSENEIRRRQDEISARNVGGNFISNTINAGLNSSYLKSTRVLPLALSTFGVGDVYRKGREQQAGLAGRTFGLNAQNFSTLNNIGSSTDRKKLISLIGNSGAGADAQNRQSLQNVVNELGKTIPYFKEIEITSGNFAELNIAVNQAIVVAREKNRVDEIALKTEKERIAFIGQQKLISSELGIRQNVANIGFGGIQERRNLITQNRLSLIEPILTSKQFSSEKTKAEVSEIQTRQKEGLRGITGELKSALTEALISSPSSGGAAVQEALLSNNPANIIKLLEGSDSEKVKELLFQYRNKIETLNAETDKTIKITELRNKIELEAEMVQRKRTSFLGGSSLGGSQAIAKFGSAFDTRNYSQDYRSLKIQQNDAFLQLGSEFEGLTGFKPLSKEFMAAQESAKKTKQANVLNNLAANFLTTLNPYGAGYRDTYGVPYGQETLVKSLKNYETTFDKGSEKEATVKELLAQFELLNSKDTPTTLGEINKDTESRLKELEEQRKTIEQISKTKIEIKNVIDGTINIVSQALSDGQKAEVQEQIQQAVRAVLEKTYKQIEAAKGTPAPPTIDGTKTTAARG